MIYLVALVILTILFIGGCIVDDVRQGNMKNPLKN